MSLPFQDQTLACRLKSINNDHSATNMFKDFRIDLIFFEHFAVVLKWKESRIERNKIFCNFFLLYGLKFSGMDGQMVIIPAFQVRSFGSSKKLWCLSEPQPHRTKVKLVRANVWRTSLDTLGLLGWRYPLVPITSQWGFTPWLGEFPRWIMRYRWVNQL